MKKITTLLALLILLGCAKDELEFEAPFAEVPDALQIMDPIGLKLESAIVTNKVAINANLVCFFMRLALLRFPNQPLRT